MSVEAMCKTVTRHSYPSDWQRCHQKPRQVELAALLHSWLRPSGEHRILTFPLSHRNKAVSPLPLQEQSQRKLGKIKALSKVQ